MSMMQGGRMQPGTLAPDFHLPNTNSPGGEVALGRYSDDAGFVVMFLCNHCPFVVHLQDAIVKVANEYQARGMRFFAISSNDIHAYPQDAPDKMTQLAQDKHFPFPYLYDATQRVTKAYGAVCTPDFFVFDNLKRCTYHGRFDAASPGNDVEITGGDLRLALEALLDKKPALATQHPSIGCGIKWLPREGH